MAGVAHAPYGPERPMSLDDAVRTHEAFDVDKELLKAISIGPDWTAPAFRNRSSGDAPQYRMRQERARGSDAVPLRVAREKYSDKVAGANYYKYPIYASFDSPKLFNLTSDRLNKLERFARRVYDKLDSKNTTEFTILAGRAKNRLGKVRQAQRALYDDKFPFAKIYVPCDERHLLLYYEANRRGSEITLRWIPKEWYDAPLSEDITDFGRQAWVGVVDHLQLYADGLRDGIRLLAPQVEKMCRAVRHPIFRAIFEGKADEVSRMAAAEAIEDPALREGTVYALSTLAESGMTFLWAAAGPPGVVIISVYKFFQKVCQIFGYVNLAKSIHDLSVGCDPTKPCYSGIPDGIQPGEKVWDVVAIACGPTPPTPPTPPKKSGPPARSGDSKPALASRWNSPWTWGAVGGGMIFLALVVRRLRS